MDEFTSFITGSDDYDAETGTWRGCRIIQSQDEDGAGWVAIGPTEPGKGVVRRFRFTPDGQLRRFEAFSQEAPEFSNLLLTRTIDITSLEGRHAMHASTRKPMPSIPMGSQLVDQVWVGETATLLPSPLGGKGRHHVVPDSIDPFFQVTLDGEIVGISELYGEDLPSYYEAFSGQLEA